MATQQRPEGGERVNLQFQAGGGARIPKLSVYLTYSRNHTEANVAGAEWVNSRGVREESLE